MNASGGLTVPWAYVCHDNHRLMPAKVGKSLRLITAPEYRIAKKAAELLLRRQWQGVPLTGGVVLIGRVFVPDLRKRDPGNYRKLLTDALSGIAYTDDAQLERETWERAGVDRRNPRIELTVTLA